jgi:hypothetical protein
MRRYLSRILGPYLAALSGWLGGDLLGLEAPLLSDLETALTTASVLVLYGVTHRALDALGINPDDVASGGSGGGGGL